MVITIQCAWPVLLAYVLIVLLVAAGVVAVVTFHAGAPFYMAMDRFPHLVALREECRRKRKNALILGLVLGIAVVLAWRPFTEYPGGSGDGYESDMRGDGGQHRRQVVIMARRPCMAEVSPGFGGGGGAPR